MSGLHLSPGFINTIEVLVIEFTGTLESIDMEASDEDLEASDEGTHGHMVSHMDVYIHVQ